MRSTILATFGIVAALTAAASGQDPPENADLLGNWDGFFGSYADVWGEGQYAYIAHFGDSAIHIVDISDPSQPVGTEYRLPEPMQNASAQDVKVGNGLLFIALESTLEGSVHIVDVSDPTDPAAVSNVIIPGFTGIHNTFYDEGFLYIADSSSPRVGVLDLREYGPENPPPSTISGTFRVIENVGNSIVHDITVRNGRLYAAAWDSGLRIYDVSDIAEEEPTFLGSAPGNNTHSCWPTDDGAFVVTGEERAFGGIKVYRITPQGLALNLELTDSLVLPSSQAFSVHNQVVDGYRLYNSWYQAGLQVFDIDPVSGELIFAASYDTSSSSPNGYSGAWGVYPLLGPDRVLVSDMGAGLFIVSLCEGVENDCNCNGVDDGEDLSSGTSLDCDGNGLPDECDIDEGTAVDCNGNGVPDDCEGDCNCNGVDDAEDISSGTSVDCDGNGTPDECDPDCNGDGLPDACNDDCNGNGQPDSCDLVEGLSVDCNLNGIPDECENDCNCNGIDDEVEIESGSAEDCDGNGVPDECQTGFTAVSTFLGPVAHPGILEFALDAPPAAVGDVTIRIAASADLDGPTERLFLQLDHELIESSLFTESMEACAAEPVSDSETVPAETFNGLASDGELVVRIIPNSTVDLAACPTSYLQIVVTYPIDAGQDCNGNGLPDYCDIASGEPDANGDGIPDVCQCPADTDGNGVVDVDDLVNVILDWDTDGQEHGGDVDASGVVDVDDLLLVIVGWGVCPLGGS